MKQSFLKTLVEYWQTTYSFDAAEHRMNAMTQFRETVGGFGVHYVRLRGQGPRPKPLLLMTGWPSSFGEYNRLAPMLADPAALGGSAGGRIRCRHACASRVWFLRPADQPQVNATPESIWFTYLEVE
jgi:hypothetical protein